MTKEDSINVALVYDFDGTLAPGNMQEFGFVQAIGKDGVIDKSGKKQQNTYFSRTATNLPYPFYEHQKGTVVPRPAEMWY